ncbi:hypothetical protein EVAR_21540_1 [Eumeta japonica]|uniref:Uncharacterized protein n=1 Tax=Eumeta variegata TaxID=151549 RepID=A0A4C1UYA8_EUMVA|nr:hypothetical protein EVAR_21540_1 [Eumeta japonica]
MNTLESNCKSESEKNWNWEWGIKIGIGNGMAVEFRVIILENRANRIEELWSRDLSTLDTIDTTRFSPHEESTITSCHKEEKTAPQVYDSSESFTHVDVECAPSSFIWKDLTADLNLVSAFNSRSGTVFDFDPGHILDFNPDPKLSFNPVPVLNFDLGPGSKFCSPFRFQIWYRPRA